MKFKTYQFWKLLLVVLVAVLVGWSVPSGNPYIPIPAAVVVMVVMLVLRRRVKEVVVDERTYSVANRASRTAFQVGTLFMALIGATLLALAYGDSPALEPVGYALIYSAAGFLLIYLVSYNLYNRKLGGKE